MDAAAFPRLSPGSYSVTSGATEAYNCIAWAAGDAGKKWWPANYFYWPRTVKREPTLEAFVQAFETLGYERCADGKLVAGYEKIVIYVADGEPTHAARQLIDGQWTSKLGAQEDICHKTAAGVEGPVYGRIAQYMRRRKTPGPQATRGPPEPDTVAVDGRVTDDGPPPVDE